MAKLYFRYGAMNSGKSTALIQVAHNYEERGMKVFLMKPSIDTKADNCVISRLGVKREIDLAITDKMNVFEEIERENNKNKIDCVLVDEVQFLNTNHIDQLLDIVIDLNIPVICYGLRADFQKKGFEGSIRLMTLAHTIEELKTICRCGSKAIFNARKLNGKYVFEGAQVAIDEKDNVTYESLCAKCYHKYYKESRKS